MSAAEQIARQFANAAGNKNSWSTILYNAKVYGALGTGAADDTAAIQTALNLAKVTGGTVYLPDGTYNITSALKIASNTTLEFHPSAVLKRTSSTDSMILNDSDGTVGVYGANSNIRIIGGTIDANQANFPTECTLIGLSHCNDVIIEGVTFKNTITWHFLEINSSAHVLVEKCTFQDYASGTEMLQIDFSAPTTFPWFGPFDNTPCLDITIQKCKFENGVDGIGSHSSLPGIIHKDIRILNNFFKDLTGVGVKSLNYSNVLVQGNYFTNTEKGVYATTADSNVCEGYKVVNNDFVSMRNTTTSRAIQIGTGTNRGLISGNYVYFVGNHGIGVDLCTDWIITQNTVSDCKNQGIWSFGSDYVKVINNTVRRGTNGNVGNWDICLGHTSSGHVALYNIAMGNHCDTVNVNNTQGAIFTDNVVATSYINASDTGTQKFNNFIAGTWTA